MRAYPSVTVRLLSMRSTLRASSMIRNRYRKTKVSLNEQRKIVTRFKKGNDVTVILLRSKASF